MTPTDEIRGPHLRVLYKAYSLHMDVLTSPRLFCDRVDVRRLAMRDAIDQYFAEIERHLAVVPYKPWRPKEIT